MKTYDIKLPLSGRPHRRCTFWYSSRVWEFWERTLGRQTSVWAFVQWYVSRLVRPRGNHHRRYLWGRKRVSVSRQPPQVEPRPSKPHLSKSEVRLSRSGCNTARRWCYVTRELPGGNLLPKTEAMANSRRCIATLIRIKSEPAMV